MRVAVIGTGYVGLVSGVCLAAKGHHVTCVDRNPAVVATLRSGVPHIHERGLEALLKECLAAGRFQATDDLDAALAGCDGVIVAVGTPSENGVIDLAYVREAARQIGRHIAGRESFLPVVVKSTVIAGTTDTVVRAEIEAASGKKLGRFGLGMNPEFLREGEAVEDFMKPDRIVLGHEDPGTLAFLEALYEPWPVDKLRVNCRTAELIKYSNNALLALQISAVNEIANLAASLGGIDMLDVVRGVHLDKRWSPIEDGRRLSPQILTYLIPGCGFGGSCFPKDVQALRSQGEQLGQKMEILNGVLSVNAAQPGQVAATLARELGALSGRRCLVLGLAFKPETDDVRESASFPIVRDLLDRGACVVAHDPIAAEPFRRAFGEAAGLGYTENWRQEAAGADIVVIATKWDDYRGLADLDLTGKAVFDARRLLSPEKLPGARYLSIGRRV